MPIKKSHRNNGKQIPCALTIAGSDSGGGDGIQADLKTFAGSGVHGTCTMTSITAQNPKEVRPVAPVEREVVRAQINSVFAELAPRAVKTGMLFSAGIVRMVLSALKDRNVPLIV